MSQVQVNDSKFAYLVGVLGVPGHVDDLELVWLRLELSVPSQDTSQIDDLQDRYRREISPTFPWE